MTEKKSLIISTMQGMQKEIEGVLPANYITDKKKYLKNTLRAIQRNPDLMQYTYQKSTCFKLVFEIEKLARVGLQIGGTRPQAYIVPFKSHPCAIPTADGYRFIVTAGKNPLFKKVNLYPIYKGDKFDLDESNGIFKKKESTGDNFNKDIKDFQGFVFVAESFDNDKTVKKVTKNDIEQHRRFSPSKEGAIWKNHYMRMAEKTAYKHVLRDYVGLCEGLSIIDELEREREKETPTEKSTALNADSFSQPAPVIENKKEEKKKESSVSDALDID